MDTPPLLHPNAQPATVRWSNPRVWACRLVLVGLVLLTFGRLIAYSFAEWDDRGTIFENPLLHPVSAEAFVKAWTEPQMAIYMPITHTLWASVAAITGQATATGYEIDPAPFRSISLGLHAASAILCFDLIRRLLADRSHAVLAALLGAAVFALHPFQTESVAWISGQKDLLAGFFVVATLHLAMYAGLADERRKTLPTIATALMATFAMLSKPQAVVVMPMIIVMLRAIGVSWRRAITVAVPLLVVPAMVVVLIGRNVQPATMTTDVSIFVRPIVALDALAWYARKLVLPVDFAIDYGHTPQVALASPATYIWAALMAIAIVAVWLLRRRQPMAAAGLALAAIGPLPVLGLVRFDFQYYSTVADHYLYAGMLGIALMIAALYRQIHSRPLCLLCFVVLVPLAILSWRQAGVWKDTQTLFGHNLAVNPEALGPNRVLAYEAARRGDDETALRYLSVALARYPQDPMANYNLANLLVRKNRIEEALPAFERALAAQPKFAAVRHNYAIALIRAGRLDEAEAQLRRTIALDPRNEESRRALAKLQALRGTTQP